jgi:excisionase family DNA binding protein
MLPAETPLSPAAGYTPNELAKLLRVSPDKIRLWINRGELQAVNVADHHCGRPRFVILPHHLTEFEKRRTAGPTPKPTRKKKRTKQVDFYP